jgi:hypothetical protein
MSRWRYTPSFGAGGDRPAWSTEAGELLSLRIDFHGEGGFKVSCWRGGFAFVAKSETRHPEEEEVYPKPAAAMMAARRLGIRLLQEAAFDLDRMELELPVPTSRRERDTLRRAGVQIPGEVQNQENQKNQTHAAGRVVTPSPGVTPGREGADQQEDQEDQEEDAHEPGL